MSYIGSKPADAVLETDDITDGVITTSKLADDSVTNPKLSTGSQQNFRNIIINGDMSIAQRGTSASGLTGGAYNTADRFYLNMGTAGTWTNTISTDVPTGQGFAKSFKLDCTTANASLSAGSYMTVQQRFEGQNLQYLKKGTANAESLTLSFWVKSNKTGTYIAYLRDGDNNRDISKSYTIDSANTWEKKTLTFAGDTTGTLDNDNNLSFYVYFWLSAGTDYTSGTLATSWQSSTATNNAVGQVNLADSTSNEWYITGVQLEAGTTASDFEFLPYDVNLDRCERYYQVYTGTSTSSAVSAGIAWNTTNTSNHILAFRNMMRTTPTLIQSSLDLRDPVSADYSATISISGGSSDSIQLGSSGSSGLVARRMYWIATNGGYLHFDGEL